MVALGVVIGGIGIQQFCDLSLVERNNTQSVFMERSNQQAWQLIVAILFQLTHGLAIALTGVVIVLRPGWLLNLAAWCFLTGTVAYSGSVYLLILTDFSWLMNIRLLGVVLLVVGWFALVEGACPGFKAKQAEST